MAIAPTPEALGNLSPQVRFRLRWLLTARPEQLTPPGDWNVWMILAGRGWGKTRTGAEDAAKYGLEHDDVRIAIVASTTADARDTCVEGVSGLLSCLPPSSVRQWNRSMGEVTLTNGTRYKLFSADEPDRLRGPQHHRAWADELAAWKYPETWDQLMFGLRLGTTPQAVVTTTPRPTPIIKGLKARADVRLTVGSTFDNAAHLAPSALATLRARYEGTRLGRQELQAEILDDVEGALWRLEEIESHRVDRAPDLRRIVVAVDPAATSNPESDETGIAVCGVGVDGRGYLLADRSCRLSPDGWGSRAVQAYREFKADRIIAEKNNGGEMVEHVLRTVDRNVPVTLVHASRGKVVRAEPVAALYEQGKVSHVGLFADLEDQLTSWTPDSGNSPDRLDALVWGFTELMVQDDRVILLGFA